MKKPTLRQLSAILAVSAISGYPAFANADDGGKPAAAEFYPLLGHWTGSGKLIVGNDEPMDLTIDLNCGEAANGWAVHCDMIAKNPNMTIYESDLMGVDPITGMERRQRHVCQLFLEAGRQANGGKCFNEIRWWEYY
jgi:hypothetical protein